MQSFKITHFEQEHPDQQFPSIISLDTVRSTKLLSKLAQSLINASNFQEMVRFLNKDCKPLDWIDAESEKFSVASVLQSFEIQPTEYVFMLWLSAPIAIEQIEYAAFVEYFKYLWYPSSDDIIAFDNTLNWSFFVTHEGEVRVIKR